MSRSVIAGALVLLLSLVGCGGGVIPPPIDDPSPIFLPDEGTDVVLVPVAVNPSVVLRAACWFLTDDGIQNNIDSVSLSWIAGISYDEMWTANRTQCNSNADCTNCWDAVTDFVCLVNPPRLVPR